MRVFSLIVAVCGVMATEVVGQYYPLPYAYAPSAPAYKRPAYEPPYEANQAAPVKGGAYNGVPQTYEKPQDKIYYGGLYDGKCCGQCCFMILFIDKLSQLTS